MKFMLLMQCTTSDFETLGTWAPEDLKAHIEFMVELNRELSERGELVLAEGLEPPHAARVVQAERPDAPIVTDGPFAETKEFLAGFWIVDVPSPERAIEIAARASTAPGRGGAPFRIPIEVRAIGTPPEV